MRLRAVLVGGLVLLAPLRSTEGNEARCWQFDGASAAYRPLKGVTAGKDAKGYYIRDERPGIGRRPAFVSVGEFLAGEAGATIYYFAMASFADSEQREWRGMDPLSCLRAYANASGLVVDAPTKDFWILAVAPIRKEAVTLYALPLDPERQGYPSEREVGDVERALVAQLPVRDGANVYGMTYAGIGYYWLPKEARDTLLVTRLGNRYPFRPQVFKVRLNRSGGKIKVECLWETEDVGGALFFPGIEEDFDGDGYRDFVFDYSGDGTSQVILSGKDGRKHAAFLANQIAVEKGAVGPKRIAVMGVREEEDPESDGGEDEVIESAGDAGEEPVEGPRILQFSTEVRKFVEGRVDKKAAAAVEKAPAKHLETAYLLADAVGGPRNVRLYILGNWRFASPQSPFEEVLAQRPAAWEPTPANVKAGRPVRILYEYKSPGYLAEEEKRRQEAAVR